MQDVIHGEGVVMIRCLDIHTHHPAPQPEAVVTVDAEFFSPREMQLYSVGIHPWITHSNITEEQWDTFKKIASMPFIVAIGECGIDKIKGGPLFKQLIVMKRQIEISETYKKPLIIHDVKAHDVIVGLKKELQPTQKWLVHGFRGKPSVAKMLTDEGIYLSFGEKFNPETPSTVPVELILTETDESTLSIGEIIANLSRNLGTEMTSQIARNTQIFLYGQNE